MADIVDVAIGDGRFKTLYNAVTAAGLVETLKGEGPFTVFAPTDEAFDKLPAGTVDSLLQDIPKLKEVLLHHVVPGKHVAEDITKLTEVTTVQGGSLKIDTSDGVKVGDAKVIVADVAADNGVIHVIDSVLIP
jgi:uncharacterized surface protein with fasciclin (FAS1) repeats